MIEKSVRLIGICGDAGSGKDSVANYFMAEHGARTKSIANPIKSALKNMFGFPISAWDDREWKERTIPMIGRSPRQLAQTLGTEWGRNFVHPNVWISVVFSEWADDGHPFLVIPDVRFNNEAISVLQAGGVILKVERPNMESVAEHSSEEGINEELITETIINDGSFLDLESKCEKWVESFLQMLKEKQAEQAESA